MTDLSQSPSVDDLATEKLLLELREANDRLVRATIRTQQLADEAESRFRAEKQRTKNLLLDQREANKELVYAALRAQELTEQAEAARVHAESVVEAVKSRESELVATGESREQMIGIVGHDLRTPVHGLTLAASELLRRGNLNESDARLVSRIITSGARMDRMIGRLADFARASMGGTWPLEVKPTDLHEVLRVVVSELEIGSPVPVAITADGDVTGVWDADRLADAFSNLIGNAIDFASDGTDVGVEAAGKDVEVVITVRNFGEPISASVLPVIFEPFRRAPGQEKRKAGHLGLGLFIAYQVAVAHGGTLDALSSEGMTTFTLRLPRDSHGSFARGARGVTVDRRRGPRRAPS